MGELVGEKGPQLDAVAMACPFYGYGRVGRTNLHAGARRAAGATVPYRHLPLNHRPRAHPRAVGPQPNAQSRGIARKQVLANRELGNRHITRRDG